MSLTRKKTIALNAAGACLALVLGCAIWLILASPALAEVAELGVEQSTPQDRELLIKLATTCIVTMSSAIVAMFAILVWTLRKTTLALFAVSRVIGRCPHGHGAIDEEGI